MAVTESSRRAADALDGLYRDHVAAVFRYAYAMLGNRADAEDVTQTTFVNALRALERGETPRQPSHWLIAIAHNIVRQRFRQEQARPAPVEFNAATQVPQHAEPDGPSVHELVRGLQRIPHSQREALVMREFEGRSYKEIQELLGLSAGAVETLLFRARRSLAEELENLVTCELAELAMSKHVDGRLSRKDKRRLSAHLRDCPTCTHRAATQLKYRRAFKGLALLPLPFSLTFFKGSPTASAALPTIGAGTTAAAGGTLLATSGGTAAGLAGGSAAGGIAAGGVLAKVAVVVAGVSLAGGVGYEGAKTVQHHTGAKGPAKAHAVKQAHGRSSVVRGSAGHAVTPPNGKAVARGHGRSRSAAAGTIGQEAASGHGTVTATTHTTPANKTLGSGHIQNGAPGSSSPASGTTPNGKKPVDTGSTNSQAANSTGSSAPGAAKGKAKNATTDPGNSAAVAAAKAAASDHGNSSTNPGNDPATADATSAATPDATTPDSTATAPAPTDTAANNGQGQANGQGNGNANGSAHGKP